MQLLTAPLQALAEYAGTVSRSSLIQVGSNSFFDDVTDFITEYFWAIIVGGALLVLLLMVFGPKTRA
jgi:uncharacterized integral membrane protein